MRCADGPLPESAEELDAKAEAVKAAASKLQADVAARSSRGCFDGCLAGCGGGRGSAEAAMAAPGGRVTAQRVAQVEPQPGPPQPQGEPQAGPPHVQGQA